MPTWEPETLNEKEETAIERRVKADMAAEEDLCLPEPADIPAENRCGYGPCCKTDSVQKCNSPGYMLMCVTWFTFAQGFVVNGIVNVNMSTIERRFGLTSSEVAWISSTYDLTAGILAIIFGYLGGFKHNGRIITIGGYFMAAGSIIMFLPYLIWGIYYLGLVTSPLCEPYEGGYREVCEEQQDSTLGYSLYIFLLGQMFHAVGGAAVWTLAISYMDTSIHIKNTPVYIGVIYGGAAFGPAAGLLLGGYFLNIYVDFARVDEEDVDLVPHDPRWVGAWWLGYLVAAGLSLIAAMLMCLWPAELPTAAIYRKVRETMAHKGKGDVDLSATKTGRSWKDIGVSLKMLFTNPIWILTTIAATVATGIVIAFTVFLPKLMEYQFAITAGQAALMTGAVSLPGAVGGYLIGGFIPKCLNLKMRGLLTQCLVCSVLGMGLSFIYLIYCDTSGVAGVHVDYVDRNLELDEVALDHACNDHCNCTTGTYDPSCGANGMLYFNPCYAGCSQYNYPEDYYWDCSCIKPNETNPVEQSAVLGVCDEDCTEELALFLCLLLIVQLCTFSGTPAGAAACLRCIPDKERTFAMGIQSFFVRYCGSVPAPLLFGVLFDASCVVWQDRCGEEGACWIYDNGALAWGLSWACFVVASICMVCYIIALIVYKPPTEDADALAAKASITFTKPEQNPYDDIVKQAEGNANPAYEETEFSDIKDMEKNGVAN